MFPSRSVSRSQRRAVPRWDRFLKPVFLSYLKKNDKRIVEQYVKLHILIFCLVMRNTAKSEHVVFIISMLHVFLWRG